MGRSSHESGSPFAHRVCGKQPNQAQSGGHRERKEGKKYSAKTLLLEEIVSDDACFKQLTSE
jgi:hypothetical protein